MLVEDVLAQLAQRAGEERHQLVLGVLAAERRARPRRRRAASSSSARPWPARPQPGLDRAETGEAGRLAQRGEPARAEVDRVELQAERRALLVGRARGRGRARAASRPAACARRPRRRLHDAHVARARGHAPRRRRGPRRAAPWRGHRGMLRAVRAVAAGWSSSSCLRGRAGRGCRTGPARRPAGPRARRCAWSFCPSSAAGQRAPGPARLRNRGAPGVGLAGPGLERPLSGRGGDRAVIDGRRPHRTACAPNGPEGVRGRCCSVRRSAACRSTGPCRPTSRPACAPSRARTRTTAAAASRTSA